jgi:hypothetical protein
MQPSSQQMLQLAASMLMESHLLCTLMFLKTIRITSTVQVAQPAPVSQVQ